MNAYFPERSRRITRLVLLLALLGATAAPAHAVKITELMASNASTLMDEDGAFSDWLEVHNDGGSPVDLAGWYLSDDDGNLIKWQLPSVVVPAGGYLVVFASNKDRANPGSELHTNFALSAGGEYLAIVEPDGTTVAHEYTPQFPPQMADISYGLAGDLLTERCFLDPTPGAANDESQSCGFVEPVAFDVPHGFYDAPLNVGLSTTTPGATIRYTLDGSEPTDSVGTVYAGPIPVSTTAVIRAVASKAGLTTSRSVTQTYLYLADVVNQSQATVPPGFPSSWGGVAADYDMDPDVVNDPRYAATIVDDLKSIPSLSVVTDPDHLFDPATGIYSHPLQSGDAWERPASAELLLPGGGAGFQKNAGIRMQGQTARNPNNKKHSLSLRFRGEYAGNLVYPLFSDTSVDSFTQIRLQARHQNSWHSNLGGKPEQAQYIRDTFAHDLQNAMGQVSSHVTYAHLYLNGVYWGLFSLKERPDDDFMASYFGGSDEDYDVLKDNELEHGDTVALDTLRSLLNADLSVPANYAAVQQYLDVDNLIDYMLMNFYIGNEDWGYHNWIVARKREPGAGFQFFAWDSELCLSGFRDIATDATQGPLDLYGPVKTKSAEFRLRFADHARKHMFNDGVLTPKGAEDLYLARALEIDRAVVGESARWGDKLRTTRPYTRDKEWLVERQRLLLQYFPQRTSHVLDQLRSRGLYPLIDAPDFNQHGGDFFPGFDLEMSASRGTVYYTDDGSDPRLPGGALAPGAQIYSGPIAMAASAHVAARARDGAEWSALTEADFLVATPLRISEIMYNAPGGSAFDFIEIENVGTGPVSLGGIAFTAGITFTFPAMSLPGGGHVLVVENVASFESQHGPGHPIAGVYSGSLSNGGEQLRLEDGSGGAIHDFEYDDAWYPTTDGGGFSMVIRDVNADRSVWGQPSGWRPSTFSGGSPGDPELPLCGDGVDNDGDALADGADPGCAGPTANAENPACNDGIDNDGDSQIDLADDHCGAASEDSESPSSIDPFLCYKAKRNAASDRIDPTILTLDDAVDGARDFKVTTEVALCTAGEVNESGGVADAATHLEGYKIKEAPGVPKHLPHLGLQLESVFGPIVVDTKPRVDRLLVPTAVSESGPVPAPDPGSHDVDHYKCYAATLSKLAPEYFPRSAQAHFAGGFDAADFDLRRPSRVCSPVDKEGEGIKNDEGWLVCYPAKVDKFSTKHVKRSGLDAANQLGEWVLDTIKEEELCVPSRLVGGL